jgi:hypothetical protein
MDMMKVRIHFYNDMKQHMYFFTDPDYKDPIASKFLQRFKQSNSVKAMILTDLKSLLSESVNSEAFTTNFVHEKCSLYLFKNKDKQYKNEDVFFLLRFAVTGNPVGAPIGEITEIVG